MKIAFFLLLFGTETAAQVVPGNVQTPTLGLVYDQNAAAIRPLDGVPGSATLGTVLGGSRLVSTAIGEAYALAIDGDGAVTIVARGLRRPMPLSDGAASAVVSPGGLSAALYWSGSRTVRVFAGMPESPVAERDIVLEAEPALLALSDDGASLLAVTHNGRLGDTLSRYTGSAAVGIERYPSRITALAFLPGSPIAIVAVARSIFVDSPAFGAQKVADSLEGVVAVSGSVDGARIFYATRSGRVVKRSLASAAETSVICACRPDALSPLRGDSVFRLNSLGDHPVWLLDAGGDRMTVHFVAAPADTSR